MKPYVYLTCPRCHERIKEPFPRGQTSVYVHKARDCRARLITRTSTATNRHSVLEIPAYKSIEEVLEECVA